MSAGRPLTDAEQGELYRFCKKNERAYSLLRRLVSFGLQPDIPSVLDREKGDLTWAQGQRQAEIARLLIEPGYLNRRDLMNRFSISMPQASADIQRFAKNNPAAMRYSWSRKRYERRASSRGESR